MPIPSRDFRCLLPVVRLIPSHRPSAPLYGRLDPNGQKLFLVLLAVHANLPAETINGIGAWYTLSRVVYAISYVWTESETPSFLRSVAWWSGNISCITALVLAGKEL